MGACCSQLGFRVRILFSEWGIILQKRKNAEAGHHSTQQRSCFYQRSIKYRQSVERRVVHDLLTIAFKSVSTNSTTSLVGGCEKSLLEACFFFGGVFSIVGLLVFPLKSHTSYLLSTRCKPRKWDVALEFQHLFFLSKWSNTDWERSKSSMLIRRKRKPNQPQVPREGDSESNISYISCREQWSCSIFETPSRHIYQTFPFFLISPHIQSLLFPTINPPNFHPSVETLLSQDLLASQTV